VRVVDATSDSLVPLSEEEGKGWAETKNKSLLYVYISIIKDDRTSFQINSTYTSSLQSDSTHVAPDQRPP
jgi:hypothetical protein